MKEQELLETIASSQVKIDPKKVQIFQSNPPRKWTLSLECLSAPYKHYRTCLNKHLLFCDSDKEKAKRRYEEVKLAITNGKYILQFKEIDNLQIRFLVILFI